MAVSMNFTAVLHGRFLHAMGNWGANLHPIVDWLECDNLLFPAWEISCDAVPDWPKPPSRSRAPALNILNIVWKVPYVPRSQLADGSQIYTNENTSLNYDPDLTLPNPNPLIRTHTSLCACSVLSRYAIFEKILKLCLFRRQSHRAAQAILPDDPVIRVFTWMFGISLALILVDGR